MNLFLAPPKRSSKNNKSHVPINSAFNLWPARLASTQKKDRSIEVCPKSGQSAHSDAFGWSPLFDYFCVCTHSLVPNHLCAIISDFSCSGASNHLPTNCLWLKRPTYCQHNWHLSFGVCQNLWPVCVYSVGMCFNNYVRSNQSGKILKRQTPTSAIVPKRRRCFKLPISNGRQTSRPFSDEAFYCFAFSYPGLLFVEGVIDSLF